MPEPTPADFIDRARRFELAARVVVCKGHSDTAPAVLHLIAHALELTLKAVLLREGRTVEELKRKPYGHDLVYMWKRDEVAFLRERVPEIAATVVMDARCDGRWTDLPDGDPGKLFFEQVPVLSELHSSQSGFAARYPVPGNHEYPRVPFLVDVIGPLIDLANSRP